MLDLTGRSNSIRPKQLDQRRTLNSGDAMQGHSQP